MVAALVKVLKLPAVQASLIPGPNLPVTEFLKLSLPKKSSALVFNKITSWFSTDAPTTSLDCLLSRPILPREFLDELMDTVGQAWFNGCTSIVDCRYNDGRDRLPLSALTLWKKLLRVVDDQKMGRRSQDWITTELDKPDVDSADHAALENASSLLDTLGWDTKIDTNWTTFNLAIILSNAWLTDNHIDMMMADLSARVEADPSLANTVLIAPLDFSVAITNGATAKTYDRQTSTLLARYEQQIKKKELVQLYFPLHVHKNHWIPGLVDFKEDLIGTSDSHVKIGAPPLKFVKDLKRWLKKQFGRDFVYQGDSLEHGDQRDTSSCSVITCNTIAVNALGEVLWEQKHAAGAWATCFIHLVCHATILKMPCVPPTAVAPPILTAETPAKSAEADLDESADVDAITPAKKPKKANGFGTSKSAAVAQKTRNAVKTVTQADPRKYTVWQEKLRATGKHPDPDIKFHPTDPTLPRHSSCGNWVTMGEVYEAGQWNHHFKTACPKLHPEKKQKMGNGLGRVPTLHGMGWTTGKSSAKSMPAVPCLGITLSTCPRLSIYLKHPGAFGGSSRSVTFIAHELFGKIFGCLNTRDKEILADTQRNERQWVNDHAKQRVFLTSCKKQVAANSVGSRILPCSEYSSVLGLIAFKKAICCPIPIDENYIYVNEQYRNQALGHIYAQTAGLREIIETADAKNTPCIKFAQGTLQGKYSDFKVFGGLVEAMVQKVDHVECGVGMQNFKYPPSWDEMVHIVNIHSPRAARALWKHLSLCAHRSFHEKEAQEPRFPMQISKRTFTLVQEHLAALKYDGPVALSCDDTKLFAVADPEAMKQILADPKIVKGTKVHLWCFIPLLGITPIVLAAIPIHDMTTDELLPPLEKILYGLLDRKICVILYACDGMETERSLQRKLVKKADNVIHYKITSPIPGAADLELVIATFRRYPGIMIQDSKHALKTFRNNLFTGAKLLTMGNFAMHTSPARSPTSSGSRWLFGRATFWMRGKYLAAAGYKEQQYFLSREAVDIAHYLIKGIISLIIVHRDHVPGNIPLLPWSHASEPCKHTHGNSRDIVKDFSFLDFIFMILKLRITMCEAVLSGKASDGKEAAQGYTHTYFDAAGAELAKLPVYPSNDEIKEAAAECESLIALLGITPAQLYENVPAPLPGITAWFPESDDRVEPEEEFDNIKLVISEAEELQTLIDAEERLDVPVRTMKQDCEFTSLTCASIVIAVDEHMRVQELHRVDEDLVDQILGDEYLTLHDMLVSVATALSAVQLPSEPSEVFGQSTNTTFEILDFKALVCQRRQHQTRQAATCTRIKGKNTDDVWTAPEESTRRQILRKYHEILKEDQARAVKGGGAATRGTKLFQDTNLEPRHLALVMNAGLTHFKPLSIGNFGIIWTEVGLWVGRVNALYCKGGGKNGKHGTAMQHHNISAFSSINVQVFELTHARHFHVVPQATAFLHTYQYCQLPPFTFLSHLAGNPTMNAVGLELTPEDASLFKDLNSVVSHLNAAVKASQKRKTAAEIAAEGKDTTQGF
ncbi:hypothetical protein B0H17DRAFT_1133424 [Mycena rosella]|uniref:Ubiquitin-like protease family profile domain-containing protein n=1 Tax=Mycena rosella TaxID=1033263 RepID=A0AAD7GF01_MYCRO|nr:hypothetical protein B0H17DRAFT_1133424 [Mycena rosella]